MGWKSGGRRSATASDETTAANSSHAALIGHPAVRDCAVVGVPHETLGEVPVAYIVWEAPDVAQTEYVLEHCRSLLAPYKLPHAMRAIDTIPRTGSGKVIRFKLRELYVSGE